MSAFLRGQSIADADLLASIGPGLAPSAEAPIASRDWNHFAFALGLRLLIVYANESKSQQHVLDICKTALATMVTLDPGAAEEDRHARLGMIEATLRPMTMFARSVAAELQLRIFRWGTRRARRDRTLHDSLADLARDATEAHAEIAARAGNDADAARDAERAAQRADVATVLAGRASSLSHG